MKVDISKIPNDLFRVYLMNRAEDIFCKKKSLNEILDALELEFEEVDEDQKKQANDIINEYIQFLEKYNYVVCDLFDYIQNMDHDRMEYFDSSMRILFDKYDNSIKIENNSYLCNLNDEIGRGTIEIYNIDELKEDTILVKNKKICYNDFIYSSKTFNSSTYIFDVLTIPNYSHTDIKWIMDIIINLYEIINNNIINNLKYSDYIIKEKDYNFIPANLKE